MGREIHGWLSSSGLLINYRGGGGGRRALLKSLACKLPTTGTVPQAEWGFPTSSLLRQLLTPPKVISESQGPFHNEASWCAQVRQLEVEINRNRGLLPTPTTKADGICTHFSYPVVLQSSNCHTKEKGKHMAS